MEKIRFVDLFAGIGGFHCAIKNYANKNNIETECVMVSEINNKSIKVYKDNFLETKDMEFKDIKKINVNDVPQHDILFGGFPCQSFSVAGKRLGLDDERGTLFFDIINILKEKKPEYILLEKVKNLTKINNGETYEMMIDELKNLGYHLPKEPIILSPTDFGVPQLRNRVYIIGSLNNKEFENFTKETFKEKEIEINTIDFLENNGNDLFNSNTYEREAICFWFAFVSYLKTKFKTIPVIWLDEFKKENLEKDINKLPKWKRDYILKMRELYFEKENTNMIDFLIERFNPWKWNKNYRKLEWQVGNKEWKLETNLIFSFRQSGIRIKKFDTFPTLTATGKPYYYSFNSELKQLTTRDYENLQSFPKDFKIDENDNDAYKQFGNAVNVKVVEKIIEKMLTLKS